MSELDETIKDGRGWRLDTSQSLLGGLLGPNDTITDMKIYTHAEREQLAQEGRKWGELSAMPGDSTIYQYVSSRRMAIPHEELIAVEQRRQLEEIRVQSTTEWRDMLEVLPTIHTRSIVTRSLTYPDLDENVLRRIEGRFQHALGRNCPSRETVQKLMRTAFLASLTCEEGRPVRFALGLLNQTSNPYHDQLIFDSPRPYEIRELTKLAPACDPDKSVICLRVNSRSAIEIFGFLHTGASIVKMRRGEAHDGAFWQIPVVRVTGPGDVTIEVGPERVVNIQSGVVTDAGLPVLSDDGPIQRYLKYYKIDTVMPTILQDILDVRHGGGFFFVPPNSASLVSNWCDIRYRFAQPCRLLSHSLTRLRDLMPHQNETCNLTEKKASSVYLELQRADLDDRAEMVARMTAVDGGVVLTTDLSILGFGAVVRDINSPPPVFRARDEKGLELETYDMNLKGTRHRAAICFCHNCPGSLAFVASQDGLLSAAMQRPNVPGHESTGAVVVWSPIQVELQLPCPPV